MKQLQATQTLDMELYGRFITYLDAIESTIGAYQRNLRPLFRYLAEHNIHRPTRDDILAYRNELKSRLKPTTVQNYISAARLFFRWTQQEGLYPNIAEHIKGAKISHEHKKDCFTSRQAKAILDTIDRSTLLGVRDYAIFSLMLTAGLRTVEVARADVDDLRNVGDVSVLFVQGKGREEKAEFVKLSAKTERAIREYLRQSGKLPGSPLFTSTSNNSSGKRLSTRTISGLMKERMIDTGYKSDRLTAHSLRHTAITLSLLNGESLQKAQQFARHTSIETTEIYAHNLEMIDNSCAETIEQAVFG